MQLVIGFVVLISSDNSDISFFFLIILMLIIPFYRVKRLFLVELASCHLMISGELCFFFFKAERMNIYHTNKMLISSSFKHLKKRKPSLIIAPSGRILCALCILVTETATDIY